MWSFLRASVRDSCVESQLILRFSAPDIAQALRRRQQKFFTEEETFDLS